MWYVVQVQSGNELKTKELCNYLIGDEFLLKCFIPQYEQMKKYTGTWHKKMDVLFPGYMFIQTENINYIFHLLKGVPKLTKILGTDHEFVPIDITEKRFLEKFLNEGNVLEISTGYMVGEQVHIMDGPMKEFNGKIKKINRHKRIAIIEIEMFGRSMEVSVGLEVVGRVEDMVFI